MFTAKVYRIMVGSLSGAMEEVYVAKETIRKWNQQNAEREGKVFIPVEWASNPEAIRDVDVVVGVVDNWVNKQEIVEESIAAGKRVMLFFNAVQDSENTISGELEDVRLFKDRVQTQTFNASFYSNAEFVNQLNERLNAF